MRLSNLSTSRLLILYTRIHSHSSMCKYTQTYYSVTYVDYVLYSNTLSTGSYVTSAGISYLAQKCEAYA